MATITLTVADAKVPLIQAVVAEYNEEHGTALTVQQWAKRILAREVMKADLQTTITNLQLQSDVALKNAIVTEQQTIEDSL